MGGFLNTLMQGIAGAPAAQEGMQSAQNIILRMRYADMQQKQFERMQQQDQWEQEQREYQREYQKQQQEYQRQRQEREDAVQNFNLRQRVLDLGGRTPTSDDILQSKLPRYSLETASRPISEGGPLTRIKEGYGGTEDSGAAIKDRMLTLPTGEQYVMPTPGERASITEAAKRREKKLAIEAKVEEQKALNEVNAVPAAPPEGYAPGTKLPPAVASAQLSSQGATARQTNALNNRAPTEWEVRVAAAGGDPAKALKQLQQDKLAQRVAGRAAGGSAGLIEPLGPGDPASSEILSQTGLSLRGFYALTGQITNVGRDTATRRAAMAEAQEFAKKRGVDISTLASQYKSYNTVLAGNIARLNNTKIMESELQGTIENLQNVVDSQGLSRVNFANVAAIWAGQQVNDNLAQQYAMHLSQLRNELTAYYAATQGRTGNNITLDDKREAEGVIRNGISTGSLNGLSAAVKSSTDKMGTIMQRSVDNAARAVWGLFGVGKNYKNKYESGTPKSPSPGTRPPLSSFER